MTKKQNTMWVAPIILVVAMLAIYLCLTYIPLGQFGITLPINTFWLYAPWLIMLGIGMIVLSQVYRRH